MSEFIDYGALMHAAMRGLIRQVLERTAEDGELPGDHHFFVTFDTRHADVDIADWLHKSYPEEMTVVIQHWFEDLEVDDEGFAVTLNFGDTPERLRIPFDAMITFVDPSVEFGLRFEPTDDEDELDDIEDEAPMAVDVEEPESDRDGAVVSLDSFRK